MAWFLGVLGALFLLHLLNVQFYYWSSRREVYELTSASELERFVRSWAQWTEERARIVVKVLSTNAEFEFRKRRYKTQPDEIHFRVRNADSTRQFFRRIRERFDRDKIDYQLELTAKRKQPRALCVPLNAANVLTPLAAVRLAAVVVEEIHDGSPSRLQTWLDGDVRRPPDVPAVELIAATQGYRVGESLGYRVGRGLRRLLSRS